MIQSFGTTHAASDSLKKPSQAAINNCIQHKVTVHETFDCGVSVGLYIAADNYWQKSMADWLRALDLKFEVHKDTKRLQYIVPHTDSVSHKPV